MRRVLRAGRPCPCWRGMLAAAAVVEVYVHEVVGTRRAGGIPLARVKSPVFEVLLDANA